MAGARRCGQMANACAQPPARSTPPTVASHLCQHFWVACMLLDIHPLRDGARRQRLAEPVGGGRRGVGAEQLRVQQAALLQPRHRLRPVAQEEELGAEARRPEAAVAAVPPVRGGQPFLHGAGQRAGQRGWHVGTSAGAPVTDRQWLERSSAGPTRGRRARAPWQPAWKATIASAARSGLEAERTIVRWVGSGSSWILSVTRVIWWGGQRQADEAASRQGRACRPGTSSRPLAPSPRRRPRRCLQALTTPRPPPPPLEAHSSSGWLAAGAQRAGPGGEPGGKSEASRCAAQAAGDRPARAPGTAVRALKAARTHFR